VPSIAEQRFARSVDFFNAYAQQYALPIESNSIVPHAAYSVSPELFKRIIHFPGNHILTMHNQESIAEEELFIHNKGDFQRMFEGMNIDISFFQPSGKNSLQTVLPYFLRNQTLILVHNVTTSENDIATLKNFESSSLDSRLPTSPSAEASGGKPAAPSASLRRPKDYYFCLCPNANLYIGNGLPNIDVLMNSNIPIVMGTDSLASNHQLSILEEIKTLQHHFPKLDLLQLLQWATINGAKALQIDEMLGSFEKGKKPGIVLIKTEGSGIGGSSIVERLL
jgi:cytosine/adenosine deaminase-related metal-dependent hydrolase